MGKSLKILILEDQPDDAELMIRTLHQDGLEVDWTRVDSQDGFWCAIRQPPHMILADYNLPGWTGLSAFDAMRSAGHDIPFILVTGSLGDEAAVECLHRGIADYVLKDNLKRLPLAVRRALDAYQDRQKRAAAEEEVRHLLEQAQLHARQVQQIVDTIPEGILLLDADACILVVNPLGQEYLGTLVGPGIGVGDALTHLADQSIEEIQFQQREWREIEITEPLRRIFEVASRHIETADNTGKWVLLLRDVTVERENLQRMQEQDRLAAVGQLAAGIAHDFNNILTGIIGYADIVLMQSDLDEHLRHDVQVIQQQGERAAQLIRQILDFGRVSIMQQQPFALDSFLKESTKLLQRTIPEHIHILLDIDPGEYIVHADSTQIQQVLTNLVVNARDAMPDGGELRIGLEHFELEPDAPRPFPEMPSGDWLHLSVTDTGTGIPEEVRTRIFEPFFTTKQRGQGTGLGLAQVYGIVTQHNGFIGFESKPGQGTTFSFYLPSLSHRVTPITEQKMRAVVQEQESLVLLVEDEDIVLNATQTMLRALGYRVLSATNGREALDVYRQHRDDIAVVISDIIMPEMGGRELHQALKQYNPSVRMVLMSGYPFEEKDKILFSNGTVNWIQKPFSLEQLGQIVGTVMDASTV